MEGRIIMGRSQAVKAAARVVAGRWGCCNHPNESTALYTTFRTPDSVGIWRERKCDICESNRTRCIAMKLLQYLRNG